MSSRSAELADSAGQTRDWDILKHLLAEDVSTAHSFAALLERLDLLRGNALLRSRATIADSNAEAMLTQRIASVIHQLDACSFDEPLAAFATNRVATAKQSLRKRLKRALGNPHTGYAELHDVRIAGKKVRYLLEFFAPLLDSGNEISVVELTQLQDELGKLKSMLTVNTPPITGPGTIGEPFNWAVPGTYVIPLGRASVRTSDPAGAPVEDDVVARDVDVDHRPVLQPLVAKLGPLAVAVVARAGYIWVGLEERAQRRSRVSRQEVEHAHHFQLL